MDKVKPQIHNRVIFDTMSKTKTVTPAFNEPIKSAKVVPASRIVKFHLSKGEIIRGYVYGHIESVYQFTSEHAKSKTKPTFMSGIYDFIKAHELEIEILVESRSGLEYQYNDKYNAFRGEKEEFRRRLDAHKKARFLNTHTKGKIKTTGTGPYTHTFTPQDNDHKGEEITIYGKPHRINAYISKIAFRLALAIVLLFIIPIILIYLVIKIVH